MLLADMSSKCDTYTLRKDSGPNVTRHSNPFFSILGNSQLRDVAPQHAFLQDLDLKNSLFDRAAARYAVA